MSLFDVNFHTKNYELFTKKFEFFRDEILQDNLFEDEETASGIFSDFFINNGPDIEKLTFAPKAYYWFIQLDKLNYIYNLHSDYENEPEDRKEISEEILSFWEATEFSNVFFKQKNASHAEVIKNSKSLVTSFENQILSTYYLHVANAYSESAMPLIYLPTNEFGEDETRLVLGPNNIIFDLKGKIKQDVLYIESYDGETLILQNEDKQIKLSATSGQRQDHFSLISNEPESTNQKIKYAVDIYQKYLPFYFKFLETYTQTFISINDQDIVSHSTAELPGYSYINFEDRSIIETIDDLIHENGHHFLNTQLALKDLIDEEDESLYFSPWRKTSRPIRGIYHAYCTFMWAYFLFQDILTQEALLVEIDSEKLHHFKVRFIEEKIMLEMALVEIEKAFSNKAITKDGKKVIEMFAAEFNKREEKSESLIAEFMKDQKINQQIDKFTSELLKESKKAR